MNMTVSFLVSLSMMTNKSLFCALIFILSLNSSDCALQCELTSKSKDVFLHPDSWSIDETKNKVQSSTLCAIIAHRNSYLAYKHEEETSECHLITVNRVNMTHDEDEQDSNRLTIDGEFIQSPLLIHEFMIVTQSNEKKHFTLPYPNFPLENTDLYNVVAGELNQFRFNDRIFYCHHSSRQFYPCQSWSITHPIDHIVHPAPTDPSIYTQLGCALAEVNGKIMFTGGYVNNVEMNVTVFLDANGVYSRGSVDMPVVKVWHSMIALSLTKAMIFGGRPTGQPTVIYDDADQSYEQKGEIPNPTWMNSQPAALRLNLKGVGDVVLAVGRLVPAIYKINQGVWEERPDLTPENDLYNRFGFQTEDSRYFLMGGILPTNDRSDEVLEFKDGKWIKKCSLAAPAQQKIYHLRTLLIP